MKKEKVLKQIVVFDKTFCIGSIRETVEVIPDIVKHVTKNLRA